MDQQIHQLARIITHHSIRLNEGEKVILEVFGSAAVPLAKSVIKEIYCCGGQPLVSYVENELMQEWMRGISPDQMDCFAEIEMLKMKKAQAHICIRSFDNTSIYDSVPEEKIVLYRQKMMPVALEKTNNKKWLFTMFPAESTAERLGMSYPELMEYYCSMCNIDYAAVSAAMEELADMMRNTDEVKIIGEGTDLTFSVKGMHVSADCGYYNLPDGEVRTAPVRESVNGRVFINLPVKHDGKVYRDFTLHFRDGRIVEVTGNDSEAINRILDTDEGSRYTGEFALGTNPNANRPLGEILFDEKLCGSFHITPGQCYKDADNGNHSLIHWDLVCMQTPEYGGGEIYFDGRLVRKNGKFIKESLSVLNGGA